MSNDLEIINDILYLHLRPWKTHYSGQKYQQMMQNVNNERYLQQPLYGIDFIKPLTAKTKYYHALIEQKLIRYLNSVHLSIADAIDENEKKFWIHKTLNQELKSKLNAVEQLILKKNYFFDLIDPKNSNRSNDVTFRDEAYIIQLVKYKLIWLYLEIQDTYLPYLKEDPITEEDIHSLYFSEEFHEKSFIINAPDMHLSKPSNSIIKQPLPKKLKVIKGDIREPKNGIMKYEEIISKVDSFALAEEELYKLNLLDNEYRFIKRKGNGEKMAAVVHILIQKNHFNQFSYLGGKKRITDLKIRKFLNYRYQSNIDKEFRLFKENGNLDKYLDKHSILRNIIPF
ncbi:MAG TPA: hypothetical protein VIQ23_10110 [Hanamia sp.]